MVLTDIIKRWQVLKGKKALLLTGTDEHGLKVNTVELRTMAIAEVTSGATSVSKGWRRP
jgi:methionyl-tRNA synthetase